MKKLFFITCLSLWFFLASCRGYPKVNYSPPLAGEKVPEGLVPAGQPITPIEINWYAVLFYGSLVLFAIWFYFRNEGGEDMNQDGIQDSTETPTQEK